MMSGKVVSLDGHLDANCRTKYASTYLLNILHDIEEFFYDEQSELPMTKLILPSVCQPFDVDIAQNLVHEKKDKRNFRSHITSYKADIKVFNSVVWGSSTSCSWPSDSKFPSTMDTIPELLISFAEIHFTSAATVTAMSQLDLGRLAVWLSWHPSLFRAVKCDDALSAADSNNGYMRQWCWHLHKENVVTGLLNVLSSQKHDPKCLSIAVACLSFLIEQHSAAESVLTDANISQLLRLGLSKAVYPTVDSISVLSGSGTGTDPNILPPYWEIIFCRMGVRRLLLIPQVLGSESAVNETFTFVSKWWERLKVLNNNKLLSLCLLCSFILNDLHVIYASISLCNSILISFVIWYILRKLCSHRHDWLFDSYDDDKMTHIVFCTSYSSQNCSTTKITLPSYILYSKILFHFTWLYLVYMYLLSVIT
jgi:hypothetical protein